MTKPPASRAAGFFIATALIIGAIVGTALGQPSMGVVGGAAIGIAVASIGNGLGTGINMTIGADLSPSVGRAKFLGYWNAISQSGSLAGPGLVTVVIATSSLAGAVTALAAAPLVGAVWLVVFARRIGLPGRASLRRRSADA